MSGIPFHTCGPECPAYGTSTGGNTACYFGYRGRSFQSQVTKGQTCIHIVDRRLLKKLRGRLKRAESKLEEISLNCHDLRELVAILEIVLERKGL
jgi:hypothetical protein